MHRSRSATACRSAGPDRSNPARFPARRSGGAPAARGPRARCAARTSARARAARPPPLPGAPRPARQRGGSRRIDRRVEQHRVFAQQSPARPVGVDQKGDERLGDRPGRGDTQYFLAAGAAVNGKGELREKGGSIEPVAGESVVGRDGRAQRRQVLGGRRDQLESPRRTADSAPSSGDVPKPSAYSACRAQQRAQQQNTSNGNLHSGLPATYRVPGRSARPHRGLFT